MKKVYTCLLAGIMAMSLASCAGQGSTSGSAGPGKEGSSEAGSQEIVKILVELGDGMGQVAAAGEGATPTFDPDYPTHSFFSSVTKGTVMALAAKPDEDNMFLKWTKDGEVISTDPEITVTVTEDTVIKAHFISTFGYEGTAADSIDKAKTFADILAYGHYQYGCSETEFSYVFDMNGTIYRVKADVTEETAGQIFDIDYFDPDKNQKMIDLLKPLEIKEVVNLSDMIPAQSELDQLIGKTGQELYADGWTCESWNPDENQYEMDKAPFRYIFEFEGTPNLNADEGEAVIKDMKVKSARYERLGDATDF